MDSDNGTPCRSLSITSVSPFLTDDARSRVRCRSNAGVAETVAIRFAQRIVFSPVRSDEQAGRAFRRKRMSRLR
ncbi:hypothetical protein KCP74_20705 [Salmonella enterica subsp. enterica]|nr:hypothetical protein KCP74_20705 [Salmonella enterica subsp. enterica]